MVSRTAPMCAWTVPYGTWTASHDARSRPSRALFEMLPDSTYFSNLAVEISWPIWAWLLQLAMLLATDVTTVTFTSDCNVDILLGRSPDCVISMPC